jgi:hypothetical protein
MDMSLMIAMGSSRRDASRKFDVNAQLRIYCGCESLSKDANGGHWGHNFYTADMVGVIKDE